jgi:hypothetical protein
MGFSRATFAKIMKASEASGSAEITRGARIRGGAMRHNLPLSGVLYRMAQTVLHEPPKPKYIPKVARLCTPAQAKAIMALWPREKVIALKRDDQDDLVRRLSQEHTVMAKGIRGVLGI